MESKLSPVRIQLAIQGGAAKICVLVATLEAVQKLEKEGRLKVTRIAGTSAGAIVGTLFAAGIPMSTVKTRLESLSLVDIIPQYSTVRLFHRFIRGKALWSDRGLQKVVRKLVDEADPKVTTFSNIEEHGGIPVQVLAADIRNGEKRIYGGKDQIVNALLDSCAVPFGFRAAHSGGDSSIVDGGICENLPSDLLMEHTSTAGPAVGISFRRAPGKAPSNAIEFSFALMETAMSNSIQRAAKALQGAVFEIDTDIGSFDWALAQTIGFNAEYSKVKAAADGFFRNFVDRIREQEEKARIAAEEQEKQRTVAEANAKRQQGEILSDLWTAADHGDYWAKQYYQAMIAAGEMFRVQHSTSGLRFEECRLVVFAWSLLQATDDRAHAFDEIHHKAVFHTPPDRAIYCHAVGLSHADHDTLLIKSEYEVTGPSGARIETIKLLLSDGSTKHRELLLCFNPILGPGSGPYQFRFVDQVEGFVGSLKNREPDDLAITVRRAYQPTRKIDLVLYAPRNFPLRMSPKSGGHPGRRMSDAEISGYRQNAPWGFETYGWVGEDIPPGYRFGVDLLPFGEGNRAP